MFSHLYPFWEKTKQKYLEESPQEDHCRRHALQDARTLEKLGKLKDEEPHPLQAFELEGESGRAPLGIVYQLSHKHLDFTENK